MKQLLICTNNPGKLIEIKDVLKDLPFEIVSLKDLKIDFEVDETGVTYEENAILKAKTYGEMSQLLTLGDDAGIELSGLNGAPGVQSRRFFKSDGEKRNREVIKLLENKNKQAKFVAVIAIYNPAGKEIKTFRAEQKGIIVESKGQSRIGLGYDSIFYVPEMKKTQAELTLKQKNQISHRAQAVKASINYLKDYD